VAIRDWPEQERPREKLLQRGARALSDAELLAIFLRTGVKGITAVDLARNLLQHFGSIGKLIEADQEAFCKTPGLGSAKYSQLQAVMELARRHLQEKLQRFQVFTSPDQVVKFLQASLVGRHQEVFVVMFLDTRHRLIVSEELFTGTIDSASVYPREVVRQALRHNAAAVILAHNHPSGVAEPSREDRQITARLRDALQLVDIRLLDHFVVGSGEVVSLAERGMI